MWWLASLPVAVAIQWLTYLLDANYLGLWFAAGYAILMSASLVNVFGLFDPRSAYFIISLFYVFSGSAEYYFFQNRVGFTEHSMGLSLALSVSFLFSSMFFIWLAGDSDDDATSEVASGLFISGRRAAVAALLTVAGYLVVTAYYYGFQVGELSRAEIFYEQSTLVGVAKAFTMSVLLYSFWALKTGWNVNSALGTTFDKRLLLLSFAIFLVTEILVFGDRRIGMSLCVAVGFLFFNKGRLLIKTAVMSALAYGLLLFSVFRNRPIEEWANTWESVESSTSFSPANTEFGGFPEIAEVMLSDGSAFNWRLTYLEALPAQIPKAIFPERPIGPAQWFIDTYYADIADIGGGKAFNAVIESVMNFGILGPFITGSLVGILIVRIAFWNSRFRLLAMAIASANLVFSMRADFNSFLRLVLVTAGAALACHMFVSRWGRVAALDRQERKALEQGANRW
jgi:hypothetical protein